MGWLLQQCGDLPKTSPRDGLKKRSQSDLLKSSSVSAVSILHSGSQGFVLNFVFFLGGSVVSMIPSSTILPVSFRKRLEPKAATLSEPLLPVVFPAKLSCFPVVYGHSTKAVYIPVLKFVQYIEVPWVQSILKSVKYIIRTPFFSLSSCCTYSSCLSLKKMLPGKMHFHKCILNLSNVWKIVKHQTSSQLLYCSLILQGTHTLSDAR